MSLGAERVCACVFLYARVSVFARARARARACVCVCVSVGGLGPLRQDLRKFEWLAFTSLDRACPV